MTVSVSLWSIIHSYTQDIMLGWTNGMFPSPYRVLFILIKINSFKILNNLNELQVSVSLWSIIHSYSITVGIHIQLEMLKSFRLLTELYSFLLMYYDDMIWRTIGFPSPYGVLFILILKLTSC